MRFSLSLLAGIAISTASLSASAATASYIGRFEFMQYYPGYYGENVVRFANFTDRVNLYAEDGMAEVLREAYFAKTKVMVSYTITPCPGTMTGTCGKPYYVQIQQADIP